MSNPLIIVNSALYGAPSMTPLDVTETIESLFNNQYQSNPTRTSYELNNIGPALFGIIDPAPGILKTFTLTYSLPGTKQATNLARGGEDGTSITLTVQPQGSVVVENAVYCTNVMELDLTNQVRHYLADPGNNTKFIIGSKDFLANFCNGVDPSFGVRKVFQITYRDSPVSHTIKLCGSDGETISIGGDPKLPNQQWMTALSEKNIGFNKLSLGQICLPAVHDAGTYRLADAFTTDPKSWIKTVMDIIKSVTDKIDVIPFISKFIDPLTWARTAVLSQTKELATATRADILQQLNDGMRCLDLRVYYNHEDLDDPFYTYHGLVGVPLSSVLAQVSNFMTILAPYGEVIYLTLGHYHDDKSVDNKFTSAQIEDLSNLLWKYFPNESQYFKPQTVGDSKLLEYTYDDIVQSGGLKTSKVIFVMQDPPDSDALKVWNSSFFSPPDAGNTSLFIGSYTNTDQRDTMVTDQQANAKAAKDKQKVLALYLTLTPQDKTVITLIAVSLAKALGIVAAWAAVVPIFGWGVATALGVIAASLAIYGTQVDYHSLEELSEKICTDSDSTLQIFYNNNFGSNIYASPGFLYLDFYESYRMNNNTGQSVAQAVELAKILTLRQIQITS